MQHVSVSQKIVGIRISRIEREGGGEIPFGIGKVIAAASDIAGEDKKRRAVRQTWPREREFFLGSIVVAQTPEVIIGLGEMRFRRVRAQAERCFHCSVGERNAVRSWIEIEKEQEIVRARCITICGDEVRVALDRFIQGFQRLEQCRPHVSRIDIAVDDCLGLNVKLERVQVLSWPLFDFRLLLWRKLRLELSDNRLSQLALDCEQIDRRFDRKFRPICAHRCERRLTSR